jgi:hypothetical protein
MISVGAIFTRSLILASGVLGAFALTFGLFVAQPARAADPTYSLMDSSPNTDPGYQYSGSGALELGVKASTIWPGKITAIRYYRYSSSSDSHTVNVWNSSGTILGSQSVTNETSSGWQEVQLDSPISIDSGATFTVSVFASDFYYANEAFPHSNVGPLTVLGGMYAYSDTSVFPDGNNGSHNGMGSNYGVDFVFTPTIENVSCGTSGTFQTSGTHVLGNKSCVGSVDIPEGITTIDVGSFAYSSVNAVTLPSTLVTIGDTAFQNSSIKSLDIPESVTSIGQGSFIANQIKTLTIPSTVTFIGGNAFRFNPLTSLTLPEKQIEMGEYVFSSTSLTSLIVPVGVTEIFRDE